MEKAGAALAGMHLGIREFIRPGMSSWKIEEFARKYFKAAGAKAEQIGFEGYKYATCVSVNDEICHGFPRKKLILKKGDLVKVDTVVSVDGFFSDSCWSYAVGEVTPEIAKLMDVTKKALFMGIDQCVPGNRIGDIGWAVQSYVEQFGFGVVKEYVGHGVGQNLHEDPEVPNYGRPGHGTRLVPGMVIAIEPMINMGTPAVRVLKNQWTVVTQDGKPSAHFENTIAITENGPVILTKA